MAFWAQAAKSPMHATITGNQVMLLPHRNHTGFLSELVSHKYLHVHFISWHHHVSSHHAVLSTLKTFWGWGRAPTCHTYRCEMLLHHPLNHRVQTPVCTAGNPVTTNLWGPTQVACPSDLLGSYPTLYPLGPKKSPPPPLGSTKWHDATLHNHVPKLTLS